MSDVLGSVSTSTMDIAIVVIGLIVLSGTVVLDWEPGHPIVFVLGTCAGVIALMRATRL
jgi:hypothetical protein